MNKLAASTLVVIGLLGTGVLLSKLLASYKSVEISLSVDEPMKQRPDIQMLVNTLMEKQAIPRVVLRDLFSDSESVTSVVNTSLQDVLPNKGKKTVMLTKPKVSISGPPTLIGVVIRKSGAKAFFVEKDKLFSVRRGDTLKGQYRITSIRDKHVDIQDLNTGLKRTIFIKD